jgi:hypothetical protein
VLAFQGIRGIISFQVIGGIEEQHACIGATLYIYQPQYHALSH